MFRCLECGAEYNQKPDFCDCGNDTFEETAENIEPAQEEEKNPAPKHKKTFDEQYPEISAFAETLDPISVVIFVLCIILSIASLIFIKPKEQPVAENPKDKPQIERKVADIKSFWDDTPPKPEVITKKEEPTIASQINDMISKISEPKPATQTKQTEKPKTQTVINKTQPQQKTKTTTTKPSTQPKKTQTTTKPAQTQPVKKPTSSTTAKPTTQQKTQTTTQQKPQQQYPKQTTQTTTPTITTTQAKTQPSVNTAAIQAQAAQELKTFKTGLRNTLFRKINFTKVYGDGSCIVDFRVDSSGRLVNRSFSKQSNNNSLNDEVYQAIMSTPTYKAPPSAYRGQTLHFSVRFQGGQYEVSLY